MLKMIKSYPILLVLLLLVLRNPFVNGQKPSPGERIIQINSTSVYSTRHSYTNEQIAILNDVEFDSKVGSPCDSEKWDIWVRPLIKTLECTENHEYAIRKASEFELEIRDEAIFLILGVAGKDMEQRHSRVEIAGKEKAVQFLQSLCMSRRGRFMVCGSKGKCECPQIPNAWLFTVDEAGRCRGVNCSMCEPAHKKQGFTGSVTCSKGLECRATEKKSPVRHFCRDVKDFLFSSTTTSGPSEETSNSTTEESNATETEKSPPSSTSTKEPETTEATVSSTSPTKGNGNDKNIRVARRRREVDQSTTITANETTSTTFNATLFEPPTCPMVIDVRSECFFSGRLFRMPSKANQIRNMSQIILIFVVVYFSL